LGRRIQLDRAKPAGAFALHHRYRGEAWSRDEVLKGKGELQAAGLTWSVVESIPIDNSIKLRSHPFRRFTDAWKEWLAAIAKAGVDFVCYDLMAMVDWTPTDLRWPLHTTGNELRFEAADFAAYDLFILQRKGAERDYPPDRMLRARARYQSMSQAGCKELEHTIIAGLPGAEASHTRETVQALLAEYQGVTPDDLGADRIAFLRRSRAGGIRLAIYPDEPPRPLFGLPRIVSTPTSGRFLRG
jgi:mannonate dehydratase